MAEDIQTHSDTQTQTTPQGLQILVDERELRTLYVNMVRIHTTHEEVVLDMIFSMPNPNPAAGQQQMLFKVTDRVIMSYPTAKRLAQSVTQLIKRYEQQFGELPTQPAQRPAPPHR
jgi:hypothetical protein